MLVLARKLGESIIIGGKIRVRVIDIRRDGVVKLAVDAPRDVIVHREEIQDLIESGKGRPRNEPDRSAA